jgi:putative hydrolase
MRGLGRRMDFHTHSLLSDGDLLPSEIAQRAHALNYEAIAITDHVDASNIDLIVKRLVKASNTLQKHLDITIIPGVELTHIPPPKIKTLALEARKLGAQLIVAHGETLAEPVLPGTNKMAVNCTEVDILAHPGLINESEAELARKNGIYLELSARKGHCLTNGHVAKVASETKTKLLVNTDMHSPEDLLSQESAFKMAVGSGLMEFDAVRVVRDYPKEILKRLKTV